MNARARLSYRIASLLTALPLSVGATETLKKVPKEGEVPTGKVVYVDDGKCPKGEIKEITGGNQEKGIARKTRCVKRPPDVK